MSTTHTAKVNGATLFQQAKSPYYNLRVMVRGRRRQFSKTAVAAYADSGLELPNPSYEEPPVVLLVMGCKDWRTKAGELSEAGARIGFDLLELAAIVEPVRRADFLPASESLDNPVNQAASYLRGVKSSLPPASLDPTGEGVIAEATERGDCEFLIDLGKRLTEIKRMTPDDIQIDSLKSWLVLSWAPSYVERAFWPGLAYMMNPARAKAYSRLARKGQEYPERTLRGTWRRLGMKPAKSPFIRHVETKDGSIKFA